MPISAQVYPPMPTRPCRFCLSLREGDVFADFDVDIEGCVFLRRISFDGYGCHGGDFKKMSFAESRMLVEAIDRGFLSDPAIDALLRGYFRHNADAIGHNALAEHEFL